MTTDNNVISVDLSTLARVDELAAKGAKLTWAEYSEYIALTSSHPAHAAHTLHAHAPLLGPEPLVRDTHEWLRRHSGSEYLHLINDGVIGQLPLLQRHDAVMSILNKIDDTLNGGRGRNTATVAEGVWRYRVGNTEVKILALEGRAQVGIRSYGPDGCKGSVEVRAGLDAEGYMTPAEIIWWEGAGANNGRLKDFASVFGIWSPEGVRNSTP